ncbi:peptidyl-prolyl cis-trans isomerase [Rhizobium leguminosarum]|uniref:peptidylprolyl isomerase n=1 Tax=Rhizobium ruizarguesonis TaxID=2081791 RepID=UPI0013B77600|nr:peptidylprolyl isomerase [Rhizobium ruizarguesonis]NEJ17154.1 peptidyl-prolyl cis-trans isomerase [Rhizobium ruizarguesonis]NEK31075.1 peptidyl-prolyl cis-trans isomerase [Rhizobium ruizarguesonis]
MKFLREPLLHFAVAGAVLFGGYSWLHHTSTEAGAVEPVRISEGDVRWVKQTWSSQWLRDPTADELKGLIDDLVNERLLAREAKEMGLDQDDTIIRRRLAQKLKFIVEDTAQLAEPPEAELRKFYTANPSPFETPGSLSFKQVYFSPESRTDAAADARAALAKLNAGETEVDGDRLLVGDVFDDTDAAISGLFGPDFAHDVVAFEPGTWSGPVKSGYGLHLVFVTKRTPAAPKPFETVRDAVLAEWRNARQAEVSRNYLVELRKKYGLGLEDDVATALNSTTAPTVAAK